MRAVDIQAAKDRFGHLVRGFDSQTFIVSVDELHGGEDYNIVFQRGYHTYVLEVESGRLAAWLEADEEPPDMIEAVKLAVEELTS